MSIQTLINVSKVLREAHPDMVKIFTEGGCYEYFRMLNIIDPRAEPYYVDPQGHVVARIKNTLIDINGVLAVSPGDAGVYPMTQEPRLLREAPHWREHAWLRASERSEASATARPQAPLGEAERSAPEVVTKNG